MFHILLSAEFILTIIVSTIEMHTYRIFIKIWVTRKMNFRYQNNIKFDKAQVF